jgi:hypothetical protein
MTFIEQLLPSEDLAALLGDITEEARHRSTLWYWGQITALLVVGSWRDVRRHPLMALRAIGSGIAALGVIALMFEPILTGVLHLTDSILNNWFPSLARTQTETLRVGVFFVSVTLLFYGGLAASGWIVGRLHRRHGITLVLPFATLVPLFLVLSLIVVRLSLPAANQAQMFRSWTDCVKLLAIPVSILLGGYWSTRGMKTA